MSNVTPITDAPSAEQAAPSVVVFDVGEVLIDETRVWSTWAELFGVSPFTLMGVMGAAISQGADHREAFDEVAPNLDWEELLEDHEAAYGGFQERDLYADVRACFADLRATGFRVAIVGNQPEQRTAQLRALDLGVDLIATSDELGAEKPSNAFYDAVLALLDVTEPGEILYVGDRIDNDVIPAMAYGMRTCWLMRGPWGRLQAPPEGVEADIEIEGLGELATLLTTWRDG